MSASHCRWVTRSKIHGWFALFSFVDNRMIFGVKYLENSTDCAGIPFASAHINPVRYAKALQRNFPCNDSTTRRCAVWKWITPQSM